METAKKIDFIINSDQSADSFNTLLDIPKDFFDMLSLTVVSQESDNFTIQIDIPQPLFSGGLSELSIGWFAKGY